MSAFTEPEPLIRVRPDRIVPWGVDARGRYSRPVERQTEEARHA